MLHLYVQLSVCIYNINNDYTVFMIDDACDLDGERLNSAGCAHSVPGPTGGTSATKPSTAAAARETQNVVLFSLLLYPDMM